jgi:hypothetical protein
MVDFYCKILNRSFGTLKRLPTSFKSSETLLLTITKMLIPVQDPSLLADLSPEDLEALRVRFS